MRHLVRGTLSSEVLNALTPHPGLSICGVPRQLYRPAAWLALQRGWLSGDVAAVLVDNERTFQWVSRVAPSLSDRLVLIHETDAGEARIAQTGPRADVALGASVAAAS